MMKRPNDLRFHSHLSFIQDIERNMSIQYIRNPEYPGSKHASKSRTLPPGSLTWHTLTRSPGDYHGEHRLCLWPDW